MQSYYIFALVLVAGFTGSQACDATNIVECVSGLSNLITGSQPTEEELKTICNKVREATSCMEREISDCPAEMRDTYMNQLQSQKQMFEEPCSKIGSSGAASVTGTGVLLLSALALLRVL